MRAEELERLAASDETARGYLLAQGGQSGDGECPRCQSLRVYLLRTGRRRCGGCGYTFQERTGRFLGIGGLSWSQWLRLIDLFAREAPVKETASRLGVAYNTAYKAMDALRQALLAQAIDARQIGLTLRLGQNGAGHWPPVFGIMEREDWVFVDLLSDVEAQDLALFKMNFRLKTGRIGSVVYTGPMRGYLGVVCCGGPGWLSDALSKRDRDIPLDRTRGFWPFFKERLTRLQGVTAHKFPYYLKEFEFRYNHRNLDMLPLLARWASAFRGPMRKEKPGSPCEEPGL